MRIRSEPERREPMRRRRISPAAGRRWSAALGLVAGVWLLASAGAVAGRQVEAEHLSWQDGLSQATVFSILHDRQGAVWLGTEDGLNRFDGESFRVYRHDPNDPTSLPGNMVRSLDEGDDGRIWVATDGGGVGVWNPVTDRFTAYRRNPLAPAAGLASNYSRAILSDRLGYVWVATRDAGLERLDPASGTVTHFRHDASRPASLSSDLVYALLEARDGSLLVGTNAGVDRFDRRSQSFKRLALETSARTIRVRALYEDSRGVLWIGTAGAGLVTVDSATGAVGRFCKDEDDATTLGDDTVQTILEDSFGQIWVGTPSGLNLLDPLTGQFERYSKVDISATGGSGSVTSLHLDAAGSLWVGTELGGLIRWEGRKGTFKDTVGQTAQIVTSFTEDRKGTLYFGTFGRGLAKLKGNDTVKRYKASEENPDAISDDRVMALYRDSKNRIWVGTMRGGLNEFNPTREIFTTYRHDPEDPTSLSADGVMSIHEDVFGTLWVGTFGGGLNAFDDRSRRFVAFRHDPDDPATLSSDRITAILGAWSGRLWVGTDGGGLNLFDPATGTARRFQHDPLNPTSLPANTVCSLFVDRSGTLWVGTRGGGLAKMISGPTAIADPVFLSYTEADGLPNSVVYAIQPDSGGRLWLSTNKGLSLFDPAALSFTNFDARDGLQANEFNFGASYRSSTGKLYFGGINGFNAFLPEATPELRGEVAGDDRDGKRQPKHKRAGRTDAIRMAQARAASF